MAVLHTTAEPAMLLSAALSYARLGFRVVPIHTWVDDACTCEKADCESPAKHPLTSHGLSDGTTDEATIERWWSEAPIANVAICTGPESNIWMLGPDTAEGLRQLEDLQTQHGDLPATSTELSGSGGVHYYFRWPADGLPIRNAQNIGGFKVDVRANDGYSICAPSINKNGAYRWTLPPERIPPAMAPDWLVEFVRNPDEFLGQDKPATTNGHVNGKASTKLVVKAEMTVADRAAAYLKKAEPAISGSGGHNQSYKVACKLVLGFNLSPEQAWPIIEEWNQDCVPPWSEKDLRRKLDQADKGTGERGFLLGDDLAPATIPVNGTVKPAKKRKPRRIAIETSEGIDLLSPDSPDLRSDNGRTDLANARRFVLAYGDDVRWVGQWGKWLVYDGRRYAIDNQCRVEALAKSVSAACWAWIGAHIAELEQSEAVELLRFAKYTASRRGIDSMLSLARSEPGVAVTPEELDADPWLFNAWNGTVDLKTEKLLPHDRRHLITKITEAEYLQGPEGECPIWEDTIDKVFAGDGELIRFFRRLFGSALVGTVVDHVLPILCGSGSNGKSLLTETLLAVFGEYGGKASSDLLLVKQRDSHPCEKADLFGKRLILVSETDEGRRLSEATAKELTGGDTVSCRRMREDFWTFRPQHTLVLVTNHRPRVRGNDHSVWRRLRLVPFTVQFWDRGRGESGPPELEADSRLKERLAYEHGGILRWLVKACREWQREGLGEPERVRAATAEYRTAEDTLAAFMQECTVTVHIGRIKAADLRSKYEIWSKANGENPVSGRRLGEYLRDQGIKKVLSNGKWYEGIVLVD